MSNADLAETYRSLSDIELVKLRLEEGLTEEALPVLDAELHGRGIDPFELNADYLNDLLVEAGHVDGVEALSPGDPTWSRHWKLESLKEFANRHPILFSVAVIVITWIGPDLLLDAAAPWIMRRFPEVQNLFWYGMCAFRFLACLYVVWRFGWFRSAGLLSVGRLRIWLVMAVFLAIEIAMYMFVNTIDSQMLEFLTLSHVYYVVEFYLIAGTYEEIIFRGIILYGLLRRFGSSQEGIFKSVLISSVMFGLLHFDPAHIESGEIAGAICIIIRTSLSGFFFGALLVRGGSLWIPVVCHCLGNILYTIISAVSFYDDPLPLIPYPEFWLILSQVPAALCGFYLILKTPPMKVVPEAP